jgi:ribonucleoside-diphosphate reductase alpha chain
MFKTDLAYENWSGKYQYGNETPLETWKRVATALASVEEDKEKWSKEFLNLIVKFTDGEPTGLKFTTGGRITANVGTEYKAASYLNCYINGPVKAAEISYKRSSKDGDVEYPINYKTDENPDDLINIFLTVMEQAKTLASEGGYGINFDFIRPRGALIKGTGIKHPGVVSYMSIWDSVAECIVKGDNDGYYDKIRNHLNETGFDAEKAKKTIKKMTRKGAMMGTLSSWHPDIEEFIRAKQQSGVLTKFNISVAIDDALMEAVKNDDFYELHFDGTVYKKVKARDLYDLIMECTYNRAEPGVLFTDNMAKNNPVSYLGYAKTTNPCGEVPGFETLTTVCLLGSFNLTQYVDMVKGKPTFDWDTYEADISVATRMLDNVNSLAKNPIPSYQWATENLRQIGMVINGLGSTLMMLGIPYNSEEAVKFTKKAVKLKEDITWQTSALLAEEKGVFLAYVKEKFENTEFFKSNRISKKTKEMLRKYGARNAKTTTNPPLGNSSVICDQVTNGIEPCFLLEYERKKIVGEWPEGLTRENVRDTLKYFKENDYEYWQGEFGGKVYYYEPHNRGLCQVVIVRDYGYQWLLDNVLTEGEPIPEYVVTSRDCSVADHVAIQEVTQYYCNQSVSKTATVPNDYSFDDFKDLYIQAWEKGLNGFTTYREGSMESVMSEIKNAETTKEIISRDIKLPDTFINGPMKVIKREGAKFYINFSYLPEDDDMMFPVCLWIKTNHNEKGTAVVCNQASRKLAKLAIEKGIDKEIVESALLKAREDFPSNRLGRMVSLNLRHNVQITDIYAALRGIDGDHISTLLTAVRKFLSESMANGTKLSGIKCPACESTNMQIDGGCPTCLDCGNSNCG